MAKVRGQWEIRSLLKPYAWSKEKPTEPGWYLERAPESPDKWRLCQLLRLHPEPEELTIWYRSGDPEWIPEPFEYVPEWGMEWAGPIPEPGEAGTV